MAFKVKGKYRLTGPKYVVVHILVAQQMIISYHTKVRPPKKCPMNRLVVYCYLTWYTHGAIHSHSHQTEERTSFPGSDIITE